jgi:hypothetical protein
MGSAADLWDSTLFRSVYDAYLEGKLLTPQPERHQDEKINYIFVTGFLGDVIPFYWRSQVNALSRIIPRDSIHLVKLASGIPIGSSKKVLARAFSRIPGKQVIIAHSKGAADVLDYALYNPEFIRDRVERIYSVQGLIRGTPLADAFTAKRDNLLVKQQPFWDRFLMKATLYGALFPMTPLRKTIRSMRTDESEARVAKALSENPGAREIVGPKMNYIVTAAPPSEMPFGFLGTSRYLQAVAGDNDGVIPVNRQRLDGLGTQIGELKGNHGDFTSFMVRQRPENQKDALIHALYWRHEKPTETPANCGKALQGIAER